LAAGIAFLSGILLLISGYKATLLIYQIITQEILLHTTQEFWIFVLVPTGYIIPLKDGVKYKCYEGTKRKAYCYFC
ncbi:MAG: hypothetical protein WBZ20_09595, partial [Nitrososphaeraceae archaeon]